MMKSHTFVAFAMLHRKVAVADRVQLVVADAIALTGLLKRRSVQS